MKKISREAAESGTQKLITDWLSAEGLWWMRMNTGAFAGEHNGKSRFIRFGRPGTADIMVYSQKLGCPVWIEVKSPIGKQSEAQKLFQNEVKDHGMIYFVARSLEDVQDMFNTLSGPARWRSRKNSQRYSPVRV